jgi:hypothetical protein
MFSPIGSFYDMLNDWFLIEYKALNTFVCLLLSLGVGLRFESKSEKDKKTDSFQYI